MKKVQGVVVKIFGLYYTVQYGDNRINCVLKGKIRQNKELMQYSNPIAVGDAVSFELSDDGSAVIDEVLTRRNIFSRKEKGKNKKEDIIATNLDLVVVIQSCGEPRINLRFVDRLSVRASRDRIPVLLCVNKTDIGDKDLIRHIKNYYSGTDVEIRFVSALKGDGMKGLKDFISGKLSLFVGNSGVGKSTILNFLSPGLNLRVSEVSQSTNKGKHTTSNVEMIKISDGTLIIDTPGVREFGLMDIEPHMLDRYFYEFNKYLSGCGFKQCTHDHEPDCAIKRNVENGKIFEERYVSYLNILDSLKEYYDRKYD
ncbi:MAG: ribosome small subunit-dependent GTPase A [Spirochaetes bacterium]|nr:ribosome small subunit-dependent GTPase A [Spirochaetota bacterium]